MNLFHTSIHTVWIEFATQLDLIKELSIDRQVLIPNYTDIQIHGFCDASNVGYGACLYVRRAINTTTYVVAYFVLNLESRH